MMIERTRLIGETLEVKDWDLYDSVYKQYLCSYNIDINYVDEEALIFIGTI